MGGQAAFYMKGRRFDNDLGESVGLPYRFASGILRTNRTYDKGLILGVHHKHLTCGLSLNRGHLRSLAPKLNPSAQTEILLPKYETFSIAHSL